jgi:hypothetical protein
MAHLMQHNFFHPIWVYLLDIFFFVTYSLSFLKILSGVTYITWEQSFNMMLTYHSCPFCLHMNLLSVLILFCLFFSMFLSVFLLLFTKSHIHVYTLSS